MRVLIVEDDSGIAATLTDYLQACGHLSDWAASPAQALLRLEENSFDAIVLDRGLPRMEGLRFLQLLRDELDLATPVLVLTARDSEADKLAGFAAGADDYVVKPFSLAEVEARLRALQRRAGSPAAQPLLQVANVRFDRDRHELTVAGDTRAAGPKVMRLLEVLLREPGRVFTHEQLEETLWGEPQDSSDKLRQVLYQARKLLQPTAQAGCDIVTVHGRGYKLEPVA